MSSIKPTAACPCCNGTRTAEKKVTCNQCKGSGKEKCKHCQGAGKIVSKGGAVQTLCFPCDGSGVYAKGRCSRCVGKGVVNLGIRKCEQCKGKGRIPLNMVIMHWPLIADKGANPQVAQDLSDTVKVGS